MDLAASRSLSSTKTIVGHIKHSSLALDTGKGAYYIPVLQRPLPPVAYVLVRAAGDPARLTEPVRQAVLSVDPNQPVSQLVSMESRVEASLASRRFVVTLLGFFALVALCLAALGLSGVISYSVAQRTQEIGVRMALGASKGQVLLLVVGQGLRLASLGTVLGLAISVGLAKVVRSLLFEVNPVDPLTFATMAAVLIGAAVLASGIPAARATRIDPVRALRHE